MVKRKEVKNRAEKRGSIIVLILFVTVLLLLLGTAVLSLGLNTRTYAARNASDIVARCAADAGLARAVYLMNNKLTNTKLANQQWDNETLPSETDMPLPNCNSKYSFQITGDPKQGFAITSIGKCRSAERTVYGSLMVKSLWCGIVVNQNIHCENTAGFGIVPPDGHFVMRTNSTEAGAVTLENGVVVPGDVIVGPGGDPDEVIKTLDTADITGERYAASEKVVFPQVIPPSDLPYKGSLILDGNDTATINQSCKYDSIRIKDYGVLRMALSDDSAERLIKVYVTGDVRVSEHGRLLVAKTSPVIMYLGGRFKAEDEAGINNENKDPTKFIMYGTDTCGEVKLELFSDFYGAVYSRNAVLHLENSGDLYGAFVGKELMMENPATLYYYVAALAFVNIDDPTASHFEIKRWWK